MEITEIAILTLLAINIFTMTAFHLKINKFLNSDNKLRGEPLAKPELRYFGYLEDVEGMLKNSKKYVVKGQIFFEGLPVGSQFVMFQHEFKEFSYDKLQLLRSEVIDPYFSKGVGMFVSNLSPEAAVADGVMSIIKNNKKKIS